MFEFYTNLKFTCVISMICAISSICVQYILHETPCLLCLWTRIGFICTIFACLITIRYRYMPWLPMITLLFLTGVSFYHLGVENHWWIASDSCKMVLPTLNQLNTTPLQNNRPPCDAVGFQIFGLSITLFSFVIASGLAWLHSIAFALKVHKCRF